MVVFVSDVAVVIRWVALMNGTFSRYLLQSHDMELNLLFRQSEVFKKRHKLEQRSAI